MADTAQTGVGPAVPVGASPDAAAAEVAKRRRRKRPLWFVAFAALMWFIGQGLGWFGAGPSGERGEVGSSGQGAPQGGASTGGDGAKGAPVTTQLAELREEQQHEEESSTNSADEEGQQQQAGIGKKEPDDVVAKPAPAAPVRTIASDRFQSLLSLVASHIVDAELGEATGILQRLTALSLTEAQQQQVRAAEQRLAPLRKAAEASILEHVRNGEVLAADRASRDLLVLGAWQPEQLREAAPALGLGPDWQKPAGAAQTQATPQPLPRNRRVRLQWRDAFRVGTVASSKDQQVTVQVRSGSTQSFPTVRVSQCEPTDSNYDESIEMGFHAVRAGASRLARLWLLRAHLLQQQASARGQELLELLR